MSIGATYRLPLAVLAAMCAIPSAWPQAPQQNLGSATSYEFDLDSTKQWMDSSIDLRAGEKLNVSATGAITYPAADASKSPARSFGPDGLARGWADLVHQYPVPDGAHGALIGRLGSGDGAQPFPVGVTRRYQAPVAGRLFLGINQSLRDAAGATGGFHIRIEITDPGPNSAAAPAPGGPADTRIPAITTALLDEIPRRVSDLDGNPGDLVNILVVGTEDELVCAFTTAGWVHVDHSVQEALITGLADSLQKKDYLTMPMSILYLFNRPQDYGFAHAEPVRVAMSRNHLRAWKSPFKAEGRPVWCVAATHDIGFERDERNNRVTHKIDPAIDDEREYVNETLSGTGLVAARDHVAPDRPVKEAKTATGGSFHSDGHILVLALKSSMRSSDN